MEYLSVSVIVSTYNWPDALRMVLLGLAKQTYKNFEVIIADDGSREETRVMLEELRPNLNFKLKHVWQEDDGFRLSTIRNKGVIKSVGEYLIFIDGDSVPFPSFVQRHAELAEKSWFAAGNRILLSKSITKKIIDNSIEIYNWNSLKFIYARLRGWCNRIIPLISLPDGTFRKRLAKKWWSLRGCNLACWKSDYLKINGFDESYKGWGREDSDFAIRMINAGVFRKDVRFAIPILHLWHKENDKSNLKDNDEMLDAVLNSKIFFVKNGLNNHSQEEICQK